MISDQAPVSMLLMLPTHKTNRIWRFNPLLLDDSDFAQFISTHIKFYLKMNATDGMAFLTIWEALKSYLRGQIIAYSAYARKSTITRLRRCLPKLR